MVGMENHIRKLEGLLAVHSNEVRIVGIHGMGGLGKTTMAKIIHNQLCQHFEGHYFLENVRAKSSLPDGIVNLQNLLISKIQNTEVPKFDDFNEGRSRIEEAVRGKKLLIVLDDVDEDSQVDMLMGNKSWFGVQSRIIITTRYKSVLNAIERACQSKDMLYVYASYQPEFMDDFHSLQLFSKYAFKLDSPIEEYCDLSKEVVSIAAGLPLVLKVLGSTFCGMEGKDLWEEKIKKLRKIPNREVLDKLRFSFEVLPYEEKQIFLDIACFFIGGDVTIPRYMWDDCEFYPTVGISVLINRSLVTIGDQNEFQMHDQLRDLGREIVREESLKEPGKRSRLWNKEEAMHVLETSQGTTSINALCLPYLGYESPLSASAFHDVPNLRYLSLGYRDIDGDFTDLLSNLRWLQWSCTGMLTPTNMLMKNLVTLDLSWSSFTEDWEGWNQIKIGKKLKLLNLSFCEGLKAVPHLSMYSSLEILNLSYCRSICRLDGLEQLTALKDLDACRCFSLETLPSLSNMKKLVKINLESCTSLIEIQGLGKLESLQDLDISFCISLQRLPDCSHLTNLKTFCASGCQLIEIEGLEKLESLKYLDLNGCRSLQRLPDFSNLKYLKTFKAEWCWKLAEIKGVHKLNSLEHLDLGKDSSLKGVLDMSNLNNIKYFIAPKLEATNFPNSKELKSLAISLSGNLIRFQVLDRLEKLEIFGSSMIRLLDLSCLKRLTKLGIRNCNELIEIDLGGLESLEDLRICDCSSLVRLPGLQSLKSLTLLEINSLKRLNVIPGLGELKSLEFLNIIKCQSIEALPDFSNLEKLETLSVIGCVSLTKICGLEELKYLSYLYVEGCPGITSLPDLPNTRIHLHPDWGDSYRSDSDVYEYA